MKISYIFLPALLLLASCSNPTDPTELMNKEAALPSAFKFSRMGLKAVNSSINQQQSTMSTLYGNDEALAALKAGDGVQPDEVLAYVTWKQQDDKHWFGARIPGALLSVELIKTTKKTSGDTQISYKRYEGAALTEVHAGADSAQHIQYIITQKPSVMP